MTSNQQKWLYVICVLVLPFIFVHIFSSSPVARLVAVIWLFTAFPLIILWLVFTTQETVRLRNYNNPAVEKRLSVIVKAAGFLLSVFCLYLFTIPVWVATYNVYVRHMSLTTIDDSVSGLSSSVISIGFYLDLHLSNSSSTDYLYWLPTIYDFGNSQYEFTILTGTNIVLQVEPK